MQNTRIAELRQKTGTTQKELADFLGVGVPCLSLWENGKRTISLKYLNKIAEFFNVSIDFLLNKETAVSINDSTITKEEEEFIKVFRLLQKEEQRELYKLIDQLNEEQVKELSDFVDFLISKR